MVRERRVSDCCLSLGAKGVLFTGVKKMFVGYRAGVDLTRSIVGVLHFFSFLVKEAGK